MMEATQVFIDGWIDKQNVAYTDNRYFSALKEEGNSGTCYKMDGLWGYYVKWNNQPQKDKHCMILLIWDT